MKTTPQALVDEVRKVAEKFPKNRAACYYAKEGSPNCIVGHALFNLGFTLHDLEILDEECANVSDSTFMDYVFSDDSIKKGNAYRMKWLLEVQSHQDSGAEWGESVQMTDEENKV